MNAWLKAWAQPGILLAVGGIVLGSAFTLGSMITAVQTKLEAVGQSVDDLTLASRLELQGVREEQDEQADDIVLQERLIAVMQYSLDDLREDFDRLLASMPPMVRP